MTARESNTPEHFMIRSEAIPFVRLLMVQTGMTAIEVVIAASAIVMVENRLDENGRVAWLEAVVAGGYVDHAVIAQARENLQQAIAEQRPT